MTDGYELRDLGPRDCRFAVTPHDVTPHRFCGERAVDGKPYCAKHCRAAYGGAAWTPGHLAPDSQRKLPGRRQRYA